MKNITALFASTLCSLIVAGQSFQAIDTTFQSDGWQLEGTVTLPNGAGPFPGVVIVHGSGPTDRDATFQVSGGNAACLYPGIENETVKLYKDLAEALSEQGIAVLRYDKRTLTHGSSLDLQNLTLEDFEIDANNALGFLESFNQIDPNQLFLIGHSQGSTLITDAAIMHGNVKGLISMAGNTTPIDTIIGRQTRDIFYKCQNDTNGGDFQQSAILNAMGMIRNGTWNSATPIMGAYEPFWLSWINATDSVIERYQQANLPGLFLQGDDDFNVPVTEVEPFEQLDPTKNTIEIFNGLNHYFNNGQTPHTDAHVEQTIIDWILGFTTSIQPSERVQPIRVIQTGSDLKILLAEHDRVTCQVYNLSGSLVFEQSFDRVKSINFNSISLDGAHILVAHSEKNGQLRRICYF